ncbi:hypothetical protein [Bordetella petrii]|uniref:hypothetical protein n=1 Tax=Bordetella petrii TaxID=94624 RepID=UPI0004BAC2E0|nr:hypothetical protein [Bordetella petrii]
MMPVTPAPRVDWNAVLLALRREGYTLHDVAALVRIPRTTLIGWMGGAEPRHQDGETVIRFWCETTQLSRESLPQRSAATFDSWLAESRG